jgi:hypothetical protein
VKYLKTYERYDTSDIKKYYISFYPCIRMDRKFENISFGNDEKSLVYLLDGKFFQIEGDLDLYFYKLIYSIGFETFDEMIQYFKDNIDKTFEIVSSLIDNKENILGKINRILKNGYLENFDELLIIKEEYHKTLLEHVNNFYKALSDEELQNMIEVKRESNKFNF